MTVDAFDIQLNISYKRRIHEEHTWPLYRFVEVSNIVYDLAEVDILSGLAVPIITQTKLLSVHDIIKTQCIIWIEYEKEKKKTEERENSFASTVFQFCYGSQSI